MTSCVRVSVPSNALYNRLIQLLTDTENKSNHGKNESAFALPRLPYFFAVANFSVIVFLFMM